MTREREGVLTMSWKKALRQLPHYLLLAAVCIIFFFPFVWMLLGSFKGDSEVMNPHVFLPSVWMVSNYVRAWNAAPFGLFLRNSFLQAGIVVGAQIITSSLAAYSFAKMNYRLKTPLFLLFLSTMMIPREATIITNYITVSQLKLIDTLAAVVLPSLISVFGIFLLRQNFMTIPDALLESARIDGAGELRIFLSICLPIVKGAIATIAIIGFIDEWNSYLWPMIVTTSVDMKNVQTGMRYVMGTDDAGASWGVVLAAATMLILPVTILFVAMQRYYVQGIAKVGIK